MDPTQIINERVDVVAIYKKNGDIQTLCYPYKMKYKDFEDFLMDIFMQSNPSVLDDDLPDAFDCWLEQLSADEWLNYGDSYAIKKALEHIDNIQKKAVSNV